MKIENTNGITLVYLNYSAFEYSQISIGLASIFTFLKQNGINVNIVEASSFDSIEDIVIQIKNLNNRFIGISTTELHFRYAIEIAKHAKTINNKIILGGSFPTLFPQDCLKYPFVDFVCVGDGEYTLLNLIKGKNITEIRGLWFNDGEELINNGVSSSFDLNKFEITDYSGFADHSFCTERWFFGEKIKLSFTWSSRGCPYKCSYCCNRELRIRGKQKSRFRNASNFYKELSFLCEKYNVKNYFLCDENFLLNKQHVQSIVENIPTRLMGRINLGFLSRPEPINYHNKELLKSLVEIGWKWVSIGVEFGNEYKRKGMLNRIHSNNQIINAFSLCKELGIRTNAFLITGFYFETIDDIIITDQLLKDCNPDNVECSYFYPFKGCELYDYYDYNKLIVKDHVPSSYFETISIVHPTFNTDKLRIISQYWNNWSINSDVNQLTRDLKKRWSQ